MQRLVCFGDSITARNEGYSESMLTSKLSTQVKMEIINAGVPGDNSCDAIRRIEKDVLSYQPDLVTVLFGANDAAFHKTVSLETYKQNMTDIVNLIGPEKTILISPAPVDESKQFARSNEVLSTYANVVQQVANQTGSHYIDLFKTMFSRVDYKEILKGELDDGLHFGEKGYDLLAEFINKKINEIVGES
ncbi:SGNH/GDSL hydrolase family protein [Cytobacillus suaedae]|nr:SGNH/GDSL hydrolase family protein [Cytobacillus suaedae]